MKKAQLTPDLLAALVEWQNKGNRHVKIEIDGLHKEDPCMIWVYDYNLTAGDFVTCKADLPSTEELLRKQQASVEDQRQRLKNQLEKLGVQA